MFLIGAAGLPAGVDVAYLYLTAAAGALTATIALVRFGRRLVAALVGLHESLEHLPQLAGDVRGLADDTVGLMRSFLDFLAEHEGDHRALGTRLDELEGATNRLQARVTLIDRRTQGGTS